MEDHRACGCPGIGAIEEGKDRTPDVTGKEYRE